MDKFQILPHLAALAGAYALALPIGWDREREERSAGLRTFPLVALASCGFVQAAEQYMANSPDGMARIVQGIITGIGFIGGGAILKQGAAVKGTATAASLWATGAIGASVGLGSYDVAVAIAIFTFVTLRAITPLENNVLVDDDSRPNKDPRVNKDPSS
ncbi:MAG: transporter [Methylocystis sp.]|uniref:Protein MgtC n=1 Tax=Methylocystis rosea TaxID=173366 RepID=A0A3G8M6L6_9HYPH|nr:MgtC/SapB family protein [Methylocystis rosea]AZG77234.1 MgtC/SapB family protein [Methylocystis rosea]PPD09622.1 MAG: transporter [Methylocystis sp.]